MHMAWRWTRKPASVTCAVMLERSSVISVRILGDREGSGEQEVERRAGDQNSSGGKRIGKSGRRERDHHL